MRKLIGICVEQVSPSERDAEEQRRRDSVRRGGTFLSAVARESGWNSIEQTRSKKMNSDQLKGKWKQMKGSVKERWGKLTDDDLDVIDGQSDQLIGKIQERYGVAREEAKKQVDEWNSHVARGSESERQRDVEEKRKAS
jgi:uncharacterized protein YjbJ (UPF0337 family)